MIVVEYDLCVPVNRLTAAQAAPLLGVTKRRVIALIEAGRLPAEKIGNMYLIKPGDLKAVQDRKPGRPAGAKNKSKPASTPRKK